MTGWLTTAPADDDRERTGDPVTRARGRRGSWSSSSRPPTTSAWSWRPRRSGGPAPQLQRASRSLSAPHEVFLAELGRAVRIYPELGEALRQPAPTGLALTLDGAHRFLVEAAPALEVAGFGVLLPSWWGRPSARLGVRLKTSTPSTSTRGAGSGGLLNQEGICAFDWEAALGDQQIDQAELLRLAKLKAPLVNVRGPVDGVPAGRGGSPGALLGGPAQGPGAAHHDHRRGAPGGGGRRPRAARRPHPRHLGRRSAGGVVAGRAGGHPRRPAHARRVHRASSVPTSSAGWPGSRCWSASGLGACLADDMGLGKTATVLALLQHEHLAAPAANGQAGREPAVVPPWSSARPRWPATGPGSPSASPPT